MCDDRKRCFVSKDEGSSDGSPVRTFDVFGDGQVLFLQDVSKRQLKVIRKDLGRERYRVYWKNQKQAITLTDRESKAGIADARKNGSYLCVHNGVKDDSVKKRSAKDGDSQIGDKKESYGVAPPDGCAPTGTKKRKAGEGRAEGALVDKGLEGKKGDNQDGRITINEFRAKKKDWLESKYLPQSTLRHLKDVGDAISNAILHRFGVNSLDHPLRCFPIFLSTGKEPYKQDLHVDDKNKDVLAEALLDAKGRSMELDEEVLGKILRYLNEEGYKQGYIGHTPLHDPGMVLRIAIRDDVNRRVTVRYYHVPFGTTLCLRADVLHSGFFGKESQLRLQTIHIHDETDWDEQNVLFFQGAEVHFPKDYTFKDYIEGIPAEQAFHVAISVEDVVQRRVGEDENGEAIS
jgi:hypothetical protein